MQINFLFTDKCTYIMFILHCQKVQNNCQNVQKRTETSIVPIIFRGGLFLIHAILLPFLTICSSWIRYQVTVVVYLLDSKCNDCRINIVYWYITWIRYQVTVVVYLLDSKCNDCRINIVYWLLYMNQVPGDRSCISVVQQMYWLQDKHCILVHFMSFYKL